MDISIASGLIVEKVPIPCLSADLIGSGSDSFYLTYANPAFREIFMLSEDEIKDMKLSDFFSKKFNAEDYALKILRAFDSGEEKVELEAYMEEAQLFFKCSLVRLSEKSIAICFTNITDEIKKIESEKTLINALNDIVFELDESYVFKNVWTSGNDLMLPAIEFMNKNIEEVLAEDVGALAKKGFKEADRTGERVGIEYSLDIDGITKCFEARINANKGCGYRSRYTVTISDISKLQSARDKLQKIFENNPVPMVIRTLADRKIIDVNKAYEKLTKYSKEDVIGKTGFEFDMFVDPEVKDCFFRTLEKNKKVENVEMRIRTKEGSFLDGIFSGEVIESFDEKLYLTVMTDVTELNKVRKELANKLKFEQILLEQTFSLFDAGEDEINDIIDRILEKIGVFSGADRTYVFRYTEDLSIMNNTNEWCAEGVSPEKDNLKNLPTDIFPEWMKTMFRGEEINVPEVDKLPDSWKTEREILQAQSIKSVVIIPIFSGESHMGFMGFDYTREGEQLDFQSRTLLQFFAKNLASALERITKNKRLEEATRKAEYLAKQANMANKAKSDFIANISHEIRTPMNAIMGIAHLMDQTDLTSMQKRYINIIINSGRSLVEIINDVLDISKMESGKFELKPEEFSMHKLIGDSIRLFELQAAQKGLEISADLDPKIPGRVYGANIRIGQIVNNLISNAIKYSSEGTIEILCKVSSLEDDNLIMIISVKDQGEGIKREDMPFLFDGFWQGDAGGKNAINGTGLGLPISKKIAEMMGGELKVKSKVGIGSEFVLELPLVIMDKADPFEKYRLCMQKHTFLIYEDHEIGARNIKKVFNHLNLDYVLVRNEKELLEILNESLGKWSVFLMTVHLDNPESYKNVAEIIKDKFRGQKYLIANSYELLNLEAHMQKEFEGSLSKPLTQSVIFEELADKVGNSKPVSIANSIDENFESIKVLVAEDIDVNQEIMKALLKSNGIDPEVVSDGVEAVNAYSENNYDLIFMDIQMPNMDGIEAARKIKEISKEKGVNVTVVAISAYKAMDYPDFPMDDYIPKPIEPTLLKEMLKKWVHGRSSNTVQDLEDNPGKETGEAVVLNVSEGVKLVGADKEVYKKVLDKFVGIYLNERSEQELDIDNLQALRIYLHGMKAAAGSLGATEVFKRIVDLERAITGEQLNYELIEAKVDALRSSKKRLKIQIERYLKERLECLSEADNSRVTLGTILEYFDKLSLAVLDYDPVESKTILEWLKKNDHGFHTDLEELGRLIESYEFDEAIDAISSFKERILNFKVKTDAEK